MTFGLLKRSGNVLLPTIAATARATPTNREQTTAMSTYVLIHGSWHGAWCWYKITPRLEAAGHKVIVPDMPGHGRDWRPPGQVTMRDYVETITNVLDGQNEPVVLVVHSRGGLPVTQAAEERPNKIRTLVYLAAFLPPIGESVSLAQSRNDGWGRDPDSQSGPNTDVNREAGWDMLRREVFHDVLYADCPNEDLALANALLTPEPRGPHSPTEVPIRTTPENFGRIPRVYIELTQDKAVSWPLQKRMYTATPCQLVLSISASHSAYFSQPDELTRKILIAGGDMGTSREGALDSARHRPTMTQGHMLHRKEEAIDKIAKGLAKPFRAGRNPVVLQPRVLAYL
jgi:pimeloyl-ACP methyl ester carboxylesterase